MRTIKAPSNTVLPTNPPQPYKFKVCVMEFFLSYNKWLSDDWKKAYERVKALAELEEGQEMTVHEQDWEKLFESGNGMNDKVPGVLRLAVMPHMQAITCAQKAPEPEEATVEPKPAKKAGK